MIRFWFIAVTLALATSALPAQDWAKILVEKSPRHLEWVKVKHGAREVGCYVGYPEIPDKATAVLVIHDIWGMSHWARATVDDFAAAGYIAIAPDLLWGAGAKGGGTSEVESDQVTQKVSLLSPDQVTADLNAAAAYVAKLPACNGKVVVVGFCWGGSQTFRFATNNQDLKAAFVFYGDGPTEATELARIRCPVVGFYAANDARINATIPKSIEQMKAAGKIYEPIFYEGSGHGFMKSGMAPPPPADAEEKARAAYHANQKARQESWDRLTKALKKI